MENISDDFIGNIYTSYGPAIGKICENTNNILNTKNIVNSLTSSDINVYSELEKVNSPLIPKLTEKISQNNNVGFNLEINNSKGSKTVGEGKSNINIIKKTGGSKSQSQSQSLSKDTSLKSKDTSLKSNDFISGMGNETVVNGVGNEISTGTENNSSNNDSYFNYKVGIFGYKISIWIIILILLVLICIGYFVYKYFFTSTKNLVVYKKNNDIIPNAILYDLEDEIETNTELSQISNSNKSKSSGSSGTSKSSRSKSYKSSKSTKSS